MVRPGRARRRRARSTRTCGATGSASFAPERKVELALALERAVLGRDPRVTGVRTAVYADSAGRGGGGVQHRGRRPTAGARRAALSVSALADDGDGDQDRRRHRRRAASPTSSTSSVAAERRGRPRPCGCSGARPVPSQRLAIVLEPRLAASIVGLAGGTLTGERVLKGRSPFADRAGRGDRLAAAAPWSTTPPTRASLAADSHDGEGLACRPQRAHRRRRAAPVPAQRLHGPAGRRGLHRLGRAGLPVDARASGARPWRSRPGAGTHDELVAGVELGLLRATR